MPGATNESWSMDFVSDSLFNGRRFRALTIVDNFIRECLAILVGQGIKVKDVVTVLSKLRFTRAVPGRIFLDNVLSVKVKSASERSNPLMNNHDYRSSPSVFH